MLGAPSPRAGQVKSLQEAEDVHKGACVGFGGNAVGQFVILQLSGQPLAKCAIQIFMLRHREKLRQGLRKLGTLVSTKPDLAIEQALKRFKRLLRKLVQPLLYGGIHRLGQRDGHGGHVHKKWAAAKSAVV